jgi:RNA polymerase sigma-70 factor, ECF subfamily
MRTHPDHTGSGGDTELLAAVAEGDPEAFGALYDRHASWLVLRLRRRAADPDLVDQIVQDTFLVVWRDAGRFRGSGEVGAWLWGIAVRRLLDVQRAGAAQGRLTRLLGRRRMPDAASAEEQALAALEHREVIRALDRLAPELQAVLQATVLDGLSTREAAALLEIPVGTVKTRAMRARARLREELAGA